MERREIAETTLVHLLALKTILRPLFERKSPYHSDRRSGKATTPNIGLGELTWFANPSSWKISTHSMKARFLFLRLKGFKIVIWTATNMSFCSIKISFNLTPGEGDWRVVKLCPAFPACHHGFKKKLSPELARIIHGHQASWSFAKHSWYHGSIKNQKTI